MQVTLELLKHVFDAGRKQGSDEATSHDWGCVPRKKADQSFVDAVREWLDKVGVEDAWCCTHEQVLQKITTT